MSEQFLYQYFKKWMELYKRDAVRPVTYQIYVNTHLHLQLLVPDLTLANLTKATYQKLLNRYAQTHERQTVQDFHHLVKSAILDAKDDGLIFGKPVRKAVIKGKIPKIKRMKFLNREELERLLSNLILNNDELSWDCLDSSS